MKIQLFGKKITDLHIISLAELEGIRGVRDIRKNGLLIGICDYLMFETYKINVIYTIPMITMNNIDSPFVNTKNNRLNRRKLKPIKTLKNNNEIETFQNIR